MQIPAISVLQGVVAGLQYGLLALGLVLIYRTNRIINFAHGQLGVVLAIFLLKLTRDVHLPYFPSLFACLALAAGLGAVTELTLRRVFKRNRVLVMVATIGVAQVLFLLTLLPFVAPGNLFVPYPTPFHWTVSVSGGVLTSADMTILVVAPICALALAAFFRFSPWGLAMRAMSENADSARLSGVWVKRMSTLAWAIAGLLSAVTAILNAPGQATALHEALPAGLLLRALAVALIGGMTSLTVAFTAGIGLGVLESIATYNLNGDPNQPSLIIFWLFALVLVVLLVRVVRLRKSARTEERSTWAFGSESARLVTDRTRVWVGRVSALGALALAAFLPAVVSQGHSLTLTMVFTYALIALSMTVLTGWAGQVSLGHFGLVAVGAIVATRVPTSWPLLLVLLAGGAAAAAVSVIIGLPALRIRGLYLAVTTLGFALFMQESVLRTPCWKMPVTGGTVCTGLPDPSGTLLQRPTFFGMSLVNERNYAWFTLGVLLVVLFVVRTWRDRGIARRLVAVRDNETAAAAMGVPVVRTKLLAFGLSGFLAGIAGVCFAYALELLSAAGQENQFGPRESILVLAMVVVGGLGSVPGAVLGAVYLIGLPFLLGSTSTVQFITSGFGVLAFLLYLPGGMGDLARRAGDELTNFIKRRVLHREPPVDGPGAVTLSEAAQDLREAGMPIGVEA
jgi:ABC-type branched-subunit amino acid transport system permease subunit